jgi:hypothetical protein
MGKDFFRLVELAIASGALLIPGYGLASEPAGRAPSPPHVAPERSEPVVQSARLDRDGLTLQFSKPVRAPASVDPNKFRLTFAYYSKNRPGDYGYYHEYYGASRPVTVYGDVGRGAFAARIEQLRPTELRIPTSAALGLSSLCQELASAPATEQHVGVYLHYAGGAAPRIEAEDGTALAAIAPYWLTKDGTTATRGAFQGRPIPVSVRCRR